MAGNEPGETAAAVPDLFNAAVGQHQAGALDAAERLYRQVLSLDPAHADSLHNLGLLALQRGDAVSAVELIWQAIALNDTTAEFHYNVALPLRSLGRLDDAAAELQRAIALRSDYAAAHLNLGNIRREQGKIAEAAACYEQALKHSPNSPDAVFNLANVLSEQGQWSVAITGYERLLALYPNHAESHNNLAAALLAQAKFAEAIPHLERALALKPDLFDAYTGLGKAYMAAGRVTDALAIARKALEVRETAENKAFFAQYFKFAQFAADDGGYRNLAARALSEAWARPGELVRASTSLIKLNGAVNECIERASAAWPRRLPAQELYGAGGFTALTDDELLCAMLVRVPVADLGLERLLTNVRAVMLTAAAAEQTLDARQMKFYSAVAQQCFINEYVFPLADGEAEQAQHIRASLEKALQSGEPVPTSWPIVVGAYFPLHTLNNADALGARSWPDGVEDLIIQQVREPQDERELRAAIPAITPIDADVSLAVRQQYEENPYPRWVTAGPPAQSASFVGLAPGQTLEILIAGCGTGQYAIEFARDALDARFLAVDLSLASLGYAKRMALKFGLFNIEFAQADIARLATIGRTFDVIEASGVLHHMADPWQGWRQLLKLLRPGGVMQVGLYSALARQNVVAARDLIAQRGYRPIPQDIRRCREELAAAEDGSLLKSLTRWPDFFTMSACRDLLFHTQEHRLTLPQIKAFLAENNLTFAGFVIDEPIERKFAARFPGDAALNDLDCWNVYETENPLAFAKMYQFWVQLNR